MGTTENNESAVKEGIGFINHDGVEEGPFTNQEFVEIVYQRYQEAVENGADPNTVDITTLFKGLFICEKQEETPYDKIFKAWRAILAEPPKERPKGNPIKPRKKWQTKWK